MRRFKRAFRVPKRTLEARKLKRVAMVALNGFCVIGKRKRGYCGYYDKDGETILFRSALEFAFFRIFQEDDQIDSWEYEPERIPYTYRGKPHKYIIDVRISYKDGTTVYAEIKPSAKVEDELPQVKAAAAIDFFLLEPNTTFKFLTEQDCLPEYQQALKTLKDDSIPAVIKTRRRKRRTKSPKGIGESKK